MAASITTILTALLFAVPAAGSSRFDFVVLLDARPIGTHRFDILHTTGGRQQISSVASFEARFLGLFVYRYQHSASERWAGGCLEQIDSSTNDNGRRMQVARTFRDGCVSSYAYWDLQHLLGQQSLFNPQTGEMDAVRVEPVGEETLTVRGESVRADRYRLRSDKLVIDLWYSKSGEWLQLDSTTDSKRQLRYRLATDTR